VTSYILEVPGFAARSIWGYDELSDLLFARVIPDTADDKDAAVQLSAVTIDQLLDRLDLATGASHGMARMVLLLGRLEVTGQPRVWLASRIRLITDRDILDAAAQSDVPWVADEARNHPLYDGAPPAGSVCPTCGLPHPG